MANAPDSSTRDKGKRAEQVAADHLTRRGYRIIERNFSCRLGEIDIIAQEKGELVFVEVRSRSSRNTVDPAYSVNRTKQNKIARTAQFYLSTRLKQTPAARFDVVLVNMGPVPEVEIIQDAFSLDGDYG